MRIDLAGRGVIPTLTIRIGAFVGFIVLRDKVAGGGPCDCGNNGPVRICIKQAGGGQPCAGASDGADGALLICRKLLAPCQPKAGGKCQSDEVFIHGLPFLYRLLPLAFRVLWFHANLQLIALENGKFQRTKKRRCVSTGAER